MQINDINALVAKQILVFWQIDCASGKTNLNAFWQILQMQFGFDIFLE